MFCAVGKVARPPWHVPLPLAGCVGTPPLELILTYAQASLCTPHPMRARRSCFHWTPPKSKRSPSSAMMQVPTPTLRAAGLAPMGIGHPASYLPWTYTPRAMCVGKLGMDIGEHILTSKKLIRRKGVRSRRVTIEIRFLTTSVPLNTSTIHTLLSPDHGRPRSYGQTVQAFRWIT